MSMLNISSANGNGGMAFPALRGMSAYEVAVKNGYKGTEKEWLESLGKAEPLILNADSADTYLNDSSYGDAALEAIKTGRQILVKVPNADGGIYTATYSPIMMYQLPKYANQYLYLFFLRDEKQDLSALLGLSAGTVQMPTYGQLKMLLSQEYNEDPLDARYSLGEEVTSLTDLSDGLYVLVSNKNGKTLTNVPVDDDLGLVDTTNSPAATAVWRLTKASDNSDEFYVRDLDGKYLTMSSGSASVGSDTNGISLWYENSRWTIRSYSGFVYLGDSGGQGVQADGWDDEGAWEDESRWWSIYKANTDLAT